MTSLPRETLLCSYRYDPLNRTMDWAPDQHASIQRFYCKSRLTTELQGAAKYSLLQYDDQVLAQQRQVGEKVDTTLLATDLQRSVLIALNATPPQPLAYTPCGHRPLENGLLSLLGFNGERTDPVTGHYHLGNGYRQFNPVLMRFNSPDSWSPFGRGGLNAYGYCSGDPVNQYDPSGHYNVPTLIFDKIFKNAHELVTNRKAYGAAHFSTARNKAIEIFGGDEKLQLLSNTTKTEPNAIIAKVLADESKPTSLAPFGNSDDINEYLKKTSNHISNLIAKRNTNRELLRNPEYSQHLSTQEFRNLKLNQMDLKKELTKSLNYSLTFRSPGPNTPDFSAEKWTQAAIMRIRQ